MRRGRVRALAPRPRPRPLAAFTHAHAHHHALGHAPPPPSAYQHPRPQPGWGDDIGSARRQEAWPPLTTDTDYRELVAYAPKCWPSPVCRCDNDPLTRTAPAWGYHAPPTFSPSSAAHLPLSFTYSLRRLPLPASVSSPSLVFLALALALASPRPAAHTAALAPRQNSTDVPAASVHHQRHPESEMVHAPAAHNSAPVTASAATKIPHAA